MGFRRIFENFFFLLAMLGLAGCASMAVSPKAPNPQEDFLQGLALWQEGRTDEAQAMAKKLEESEAFAEAALLRSAIDLARGLPASSLSRLQGIAPEAIDDPFLRAHYAWLEGKTSAALGEPKSALSSFFLAASLAPDQETAARVQGELWGFLQGFSRDRLLAIRNDYREEMAQGWIDLAVISFVEHHKEEAIARWQAAYPNHPVLPEILASITGGSLLPSQEKTAAQKKGPARLVGVILPLQSPSFREAAQAVESGLRAALVGQTQARIRLYPTGDNLQELQGAIAQALADGVDVLVGPLTKSAVEVVAMNPPPVPTLALTSPGQLLSRPGMFYLALLADEEAREVAAAAFKSGAHQALAVASQDALSSRIARAFGEEWQKQGGQWLGARPFGVNEVELLHLKDSLSKATPEAICLAASIGPAKLVRPYLGDSPNIWATSTVYDGNPSPLAQQDLAGVTFVDAPFILTPERFGEVALPESLRGRVVLMRLFALGYDAMRAALAMPFAEGYTFDGLAGQWHLENNGRFSRHLPLARIDPEEGVKLVSPAP